MTLSRFHTSQTVAARRGFTLIELLTVVAIIAILASLLFPIVGNMRRSAASSQCASNLRQIGMASVAYSGENDGQLLPSGKDGYGEAYWWVEKIQVYLTGNYEKDKLKYRYFNKASFCPEYYVSDPVGKNTAMKDRYVAYSWRTGYTINDYPGYPENPDGNRQNINSDGTRVGWVDTNWRLSEITYKSVRPQVLDGNEWQTGVTGGKVHFDRHGPGKSNVLFFDGHVETVTTPAGPKSASPIVIGMSKPIDLNAGVKEG